MDSNKDYAGAISPSSPYYHPACNFVLDWLDEIKKNSRRKSVQFKVGNAYSRTMRRWLALYGDDEMSFIGAAAGKVMDRIRKSHPEISWR